MPVDFRGKQVGAVSHEGRREGNGVEQRGRRQVRRRREGVFVPHVETPGLDAVDVEYESLATEEGDVNDQRGLEPDELRVKNGGHPNVEGLAEIEHGVVLV